MLHDSLVISHGSFEEAETKYPDNDPNMVGADILRWVGKWRMEASRLEGPGPIEAERSASPTPTDVSDTPTGTPFRTGSACFYDGFWKETFQTEQYVYSASASESLAADKTHGCTGTFLLT